MLFCLLLIRFSHSGQCVPSYANASDHFYQFDTEKKLGEGGFGAVYPAYYHSQEGSIAELHVVVKIPKEEKLKDFKKEEAKIEHIMNSLKLEEQQYFARFYGGK